MKALILSTSRYPDGGAETVRMHYIAKLFQLNGYEVIIAARGACTGYKLKDYDGVQYLSLRGSGSSRLNKLIDYMNFTKNTKQILRNNGPFNAVLVMAVPTDSLLFLKRFAKKRDIMLLHDSVEWYSHEQFRLGRMSLEYRKKELWMRILIDSRIKVIAVSKYLEEYFKARKIIVIRIPVIMDVSGMSNKKSVNESKLTIFYAGSPGKKDYLRIVIEGLALLAMDELTKINFVLAGTTKEQLIKLCGVREQDIDLLGDSLAMPGKVSRDKVIEMLSFADFTVLMRSPTQRYAKAGFPTKVVESLASGTPIICNLTSDLEVYIKDNINGIIVTECTAESFAASIRRAINLTAGQRKDMCKEARKCAAEHFDYRLYQSSLAVLISKKEEG